MTRISSTTPKPIPETFTVVLRGTSSPEHGPAARRLARFLKCALRAYGFRCVDVRPAVVPAGTAAGVAITEGQTEEGST